MIKKLFLLSVAIILFSGCDLAKSFQSAVNLKNCEYSYSSISDVSISGIKSEDLTLSNPLNAIQVGKLVALLNTAKTSIPLSFKLTLNVKNPNSQEAAFENMKYIVSIDDVEFTRGDLVQPFSVKGGDTQPLSVNIALDIVKLMTPDTKSAIVGTIKNFIGINDQATKISVQLQPTMKIGNNSVSSPNYIPVNFSFGAKR